MPTNVTHEYIEAQEKYREARTPEEKIKGLELMLSTVPKHKGTERLRYELKKSLSKWKREVKERAAKKASSKSDFHVPKEGIAQIGLVGPPNSGKSLLLNRLTNSKAKVARYPFTTTTPNPGMVQYEDVQIQLVEMPPLIAGVSDGRWQGAEMLSMIRNTDSLIIVLDLSRDPIDDFRVVREELGAAGIRINRSKPGLEVKRMERGGIEIEGEIADDDRSYLVELLQTHGYHNALVTVAERVNRKEMSDALQGSLVYLPGLVVANKGDLPGTEETFEQLRAEIGDGHPVYPVSAMKRIGLEPLGRAIFEALSVVRVYTKAPGDDAEREPLVLERGSTVRDVARSLHRRFVDNYRFARVWGESANFGGEMVGLDHVLEDRDIVEVHAR